MYCHFRVATSILAHLTYAFAQVMTVLENFQLVRQQVCTEHKNTGEQRRVGLVSLR